MPSPTYRIISIGALSRHELWDKPEQVGLAPRTAHATTVLISVGDQYILVDPALPARALVPRLEERAGLKPESITDVFLTCFRPAHRMGLAAFESAKWWVGEAERERVGQVLVAQFQEAEDHGHEEASAALREEIALLQKFSSAPDSLASGVDLFPVPGFTPGTCGLLLVEQSRTTLIAGDAVATIEHLERGRVLKGAYDAAAARESLSECLEIADVIIPGHDNVVLNPLALASRSGPPQPAI